MMYAATDIVGKWAATFKEFPALQRPNTVTMDDALRAMSNAATGR
jgi:arylsulfatase